jgi:hypothetical protein
MKRGSVMSKSIFVLGATLVVAGIALLPVVSASLSFASDTKDKDKEDTLVCYTWSIFPDERFKLNVKQHSPLSERKEEKEFDHPKQTAYSIHGKHVVSNRMPTVTGTVVVARDTGAHMGFHTQSVRGDGTFGGEDFARTLTLDCTTTEDAPTPDTWTCHSRNEFDVYHGVSVLRQVDETKDPRCSFFEDGSFIEQSPPEARENPTSDNRAQ